MRAPRDEIEYEFDHGYPVDSESRADFVAGGAANPGCSRLSGGFDGGQGYCASWQASKLLWQGRRREWLAQEYGGRARSTSYGCNKYRASPGSSGLHCCVRRLATIRSAPA